MINNNASESTGMTLNQIKDALSLMAAIAVCEKEQDGLSTNYMEEIYLQLDALPESVRDHFIDLWTIIGRAMPLNK